MPATHWVASGAITVLCFLRVKSGEKMAVYSGKRGKEAGLRDG